MSDILCTIIVQGSEYVFYKNRTYTVKGWPKDKISRWKISKGNFFVYHQDSKYWLNASDITDLFDALKLEIAIAEMLEK